MFIICIVAVLPEQPEALLNTEPRKSGQPPVLTQTMIGFVLSPDKVFHVKTSTQSLQRYVLGRAQIVF